jgi:FkbM family methyltransferase
VFYDDDILTTNKKIVFYGVGKYAREFTQRHCLDAHDIRLPDYVCDRDPLKWGRDFFGTPICTPDRLFSESTDDVIVLVTTSPFVLGDLRDRLYYYDFWLATSLEMRFSMAKRLPGEWELVRSLFADEKSRRVFDAMTRSQAEGQFWFRDIYEPHPYFNNDVVPRLAAGEVLVDAGAYTGGHIAAFARTNPHFRAVYAFEPHPPHYRVLAERFENDPRVHPRAQGLYDRHSWLAFDDERALGAHVVPTGETRTENLVEVVRLDDALEEDVTYIKMDIEGAELPALEGSAATIQRNRPKLAICVYHRPSDYFDIPRLIDGMQYDYTLHLRQHSSFNIDTVLYAI